MTTATRIRPGLAPDDARHGSVAGKSAGCDCFPCRIAINQWKVRRGRRIGYGTWRPWVDAEPVRAHLKTLSDFGIGWERAAEVAGLSTATVSGLLYTRGANRRSEKCRPETAAAILAVKPCIDNVSDWARTDGTGTIRRLRALVALGHTAQDLGDRLPLHTEALRRTINVGGRVTGVLARATRDLYEELSSVRPEGWTANRCRRMAVSKGWVPPLAWDDIDDPNEQPNLGGTERPDEFDETTVGQAVEGRLTYAQIAVHRPDLIETVRRLAKTLTDQEIGHLLRWPGANDQRTRRSPSRATNSITKVRRDNGIPACSRPESIAPRVRRTQAAA